MHMLRQFSDGKCVDLLPCPLAERVTAADVHRRAGAVVRQGEGGPPVTAEGGAQQREESLILIDGQKLPVAQRPAFGSENEGHDADLAQEWFGHGLGNFGDSRPERYYKLSSDIGKALVYL